MIIIEKDLKPDTIKRVSELLAKQEEEILKLKIEKAKLEGQLEEARRHEIGIPWIEYLPYYSPYRYYPYQYYWTCSSDTCSSVNISSNSAKANNTYTDHIQFTYKI